jgi:pSer/pThr/pTyr-binding forkhead associated (FHA) protein
VKLICENCRMIYYLPEEKQVDRGCPGCGHVNRSKAGGKEGSVSKKIKSYAEDPGPVKTMLFPVDASLKDDEKSAIERAMAGKPAALSPHHTIALTVIEGDEKDRRLPIDKPNVIIGRSRADILLKDPEVSRRHCQITCCNNLVVLQDLGSANGTLLNHQVIRKAFLKDQDKIQVGGTVLQFEMKPKA